MAVLTKQLEEFLNEPNPATNKVPEIDRPQPRVDLPPMQAQPAQAAQPVQPQQKSPVIHTSLLDEFLAEPTPATPRSDISKTESFLRGASQGATFNLGDELTGGFEATLGTIEAMIRGKNAFGDDSRIEAIRNVLDNYRRSRETVRQQHAEAQAANEGAFLGVELVGIGVTAPATGAAIRGVMGAAKGAQAALTVKRAADVANRTQKLSKVTQAVARTGALGGEAVDAVSKTGRVLRGVKQAAQLGATEGAIMGFGGSEAELTPDKATLESVGQAALETGVGAGVNAAFGAGFNLAGRGIKAGIAKAAETEIFNKVREVATAA